MAEYSKSVPGSKNRTDWNSSTSGTEGADITATLHGLFEKERLNGLWNYLYVLIDDKGKLESHAFPARWDRSDVENHYNRLIPDRGYHIVLMMDLRVNFFQQLHMGATHPKQLESWAFLRDNPIDCLHPTLLLEKMLGIELKEPIPDGKPFTIARNDGLVRTPRKNWSPKVV